jgi:hypothetical protein
LEEQVENWLAVANAVVESFSTVRNLREVVAIRMSTAETGTTGDRRRTTTSHSKPPDAMRASGMLGTRPEALGTHNEEDAKA